MTTATVVYEGGYDDGLDRRLRLAARFQDGVEQGSGQMMFAPFRRDMLFKFAAHSRAQRFTEMIRRLVALAFPYKKVRVFMRQPSKHFNMQHAAVGAVQCPVCGVGAGNPCTTTQKARVPYAKTETHVARVNLFEREQKAQDVRAGE